MANSKSFVLNHLSELSDVVDYLAPFLKPNTLILLDGPMAAGKTTLIAELLKRIGIREAHSPTYALHHKYNSNSFDVHHFDLHRLTSTDDIESSGFWDFFDSTQDLFFVEWAKFISLDQWPFNFRIVQIVIEKNQDDQRTLWVHFLN